MYIDVYKGDDNFDTSSTTLLSDLDLQETYRAIDSVATGRIPSLSCVDTKRTFEVDLTTSSSEQNSKTAVVVAAVVVVAAAVVVLAT